MNKAKKNLRDFLSLNKIKYVIFDLDDTLIDTVEIINYFKDIYIKSISVEFLININTVQKKVREFDKIAFNKFGARKFLRWGYLSLLVAKYFKLNYLKIFRMSIAILGRIYKTTPKVKNDTFKFLNALQRKKLIFFLLTNANRRWTNFKLKKTGLHKYFVHENIYILNKKNKNVNDWEKVIVKNNLNINNVLVIGDSLKGDINPVLELGIRSIIQVSNDTKRKMSNGVLKIKDLGFFF